MFDIAKLNDLAADDEFAALVRSLTAEILETTDERAVHQHLLPLLGYGPDQAGSVLRFTWLVRSCPIHAPEPVSRLHHIMERIRTAAV